MFIQISIIVAFLILNLIFGRLFSLKKIQTNEDFFLAKRSIHPLLLFFTMAATNFSAFSILGLSGQGYKLGWAFYPVMGLGTAFVAVSFVLVGLPLARLSKTHKFLSLSDFIQKRYNSKTLALVVSFSSLIFTIPYLSLQAMATGKMIETLSGLPYWVGAGAITLIVLVYSFSGGMKSVAVTDAFQAVIMVVLALAAFLCIANLNGGFIQAQKAAFAVSPELFSRSGTKGSMDIGLHISYFLLWFCANPMFPQLTQRFFSGKDEKSLSLTCIFYPIITTVFFFITVAIGVMGKGFLPNLNAKSADSIYFILIELLKNPVLSGLFALAPLAAIMSTMDSQLLTLSSIVSHDILKTKKNPLLISRIALIVLAISAFLISLKPPADILDFLSKNSFIALAAIFPITVIGLYRKKVSAKAAIASLSCALVIAILSGFNVLPFLKGSYSILIVIPSAIFIYFIVEKIDLKLNRLQTDSEIESLKLLEIIPLKYIIIFLVLAFLALDLTAFTITMPMLFAVPIWVWFSGILGFVLSFVLYLYFKENCK